MLRKHNNRWKRTDKRGLRTVAAAALILSVVFLYAGQPLLPDFQGAHGINNESPSFAADASGDGDASNTSDSGIEATSSGGGVDNGSSGAGIGSGSKDSGSGNTDNTGKNVGSGNDKGGGSTDKGAIAGNDKGGGSGSDKGGGTTDKGGITGNDKGGGSGNDKGGDNSGKKTGGSENTSGGAVTGGSGSTADDDNSGNGTAASGLTVKVGYAGEKPKTVKRYSLSQLSALGAIDQTFTWITNVRGCIIETTRGVSLKKILLDAHIDINSIARIHFTCSDAYETEELTVGYLFDQTRYYYPNLAKSWNFDLGKAGASAKSGKVPVQTVLALQDYWKKTTSNSDTPEPYGNMTSAKRLRLCFGMTNTTTPTSFNSAKWVNSIEITLAGAPPKHKNKNDKNKLIGSVKGNSPDSGGTASTNTGSGNGAGAGGSHSSGAIDKTAAATPGNPPKGATLSLLTVDGSSSDSNGYQPWRSNQMSADASAYSPIGSGSGMAGPVTGAMGGLFFFGGILHYLYFRRLT